MASLFDSSMGTEVRVIDSIKGKGLISLKTFKKGDIIFEEQPVCCAQFCWNRDYGYLSCDYCMKSLETPDENINRLTQTSTCNLPYNKVNFIEKYECEHCQIKYCSLRCRQTAWDSYHKILCHKKESSHPFEILRETWKKTHYPPETCSIDLILRILALIAQSTNPDYVSSMFLEFCHKTENEDEELISKLLKDKFEERIQLLRELTSQCMNTSNISQWLTRDGFIKLFALVALNGQGIATSPFAHWVKHTETLKLTESEKKHLDDCIDGIYNRIDQVVGQFIDNEGSGLYLSQSKINHSCEPNAEVTFPCDNSTLVLRAKEDIKPNDEICFSYIEECELERSRHSRHKSLKEDYLFVCKCTKCQRQAYDPDETSEDESDEEDSE